MNFFRNLLWRIKDGLRRFMIGRYGSDKLNIALLLTGVVLWFLSNFIPFTVVKLLLLLAYYFLMGLAIFRMLSRNTYKRYQENKKYLQITVKDTGSTVSNEDLRYICNPYAQLEKGRKQLVKSFRLGTASILTKRANGFFNINSDNGNLYSIIIPTEKEEDE